MNGSRLVLALAITNAVLYCCALPLWEGFDEPFHYAYVETIERDHSFPVMNRARIDDEIQRSFQYVPLSRLLSETIPNALSFEQWARLDGREKNRRHEELQRGVGATDSAGPGNIENYEAQQTPLAYVLMVPMDLLLKHLRLEVRILLLRIGVAVAAALLLYWAMVRLALVLGVSPWFRLTLFAVVFESEMLWASVAHVGNDWLSVPLTLCFLTMLAELVANASERRALLLGGCFAFGLAAKAYFLAFAPVFAAVLAYAFLSRRVRLQALLLSAGIPVLVAGPWYVRNLRLYRSLSGTQQSAAGIGMAQAVAAIPHINWLRSAGNFLRWSLWTGNWSFLSFSRNTLNFELVLLGAGLVLFVWGFRWRQRTWWASAAAACFIAALCYQTCVTWIHTGGVSEYPEPWYWQGLVPLFWAYAVLGFERAKNWGRVLGSGACIAAAWIAAVTYVGKLLPYYGAGQSRGTVSGVWQWWTRSPWQDLRTVTPAKPGVVFTLLALYLVLLGAVTVLALRKLWSGRGEYAPLTTD